MNKFEKKLMEDYWTYYKLYVEYSDDDTASRPSFIQGTHLGDDGLLWYLLPNEVEEAVIDVACMIDRKWLKSYRIEECGEEQGWMKGKLSK